ncbi:MAG: tetratricopeptide repeat protein [bacterium]
MGINTDLHNKSVQTRISYLYPFLIISIISIVSYWNSLHVPFLYDDKAVIVETRAVTQYGAWKYLFSREYFHQFRERTYRPVTSFSIWMGYKMSHFNSLGWHLANLKWHIIASFFVYLISASLLGTGGGLAAGALFAAHPVHTEAVTLVSNREELLCALFLFAALYLHQLSGASRRGAETADRRGAETPPYRYVWPALSFVSLVLAMFSKEMAASFPIIVFLYNFLFNEEKSMAMRIRRSIPSALAYSTVVLLFLALRWGPLRNVEGETSYPGGSFSTAMFTMAHAFLIYMRLLVLPIHLCADYVVPFSGSIANPQTLAGLLLLAALLVFSVSMARRTPVLSFAFLFLPVSLLPVSNLIPFGAIMAERYLYIPSFSLCLAAGYLYERARLPGVLKMCVTILLLGVLVFGTVHRNNVWQSDRSLWQDTVRCAPRSAKAHHNLGNAYLSEGNYSAAIGEYRKAYECASPEAPIEAGKLYFNIGLAYRMTGEARKAVGWFRESLSAKPDFLASYYNLAASLAEDGKSEEGFEVLEKAVQREPQNPRSHYVTGNMHLKYGKNRESLVQAVYHFKKAIEFAPEWAEAYGSLGVAYKQLGDNFSALRMLERAARLDPTSPIVWENMAEIYRRLGRMDDMRRCIKEAEKTK